MSSARKLLIPEAKTPDKYTQLVERLGYALNGCRLP